MNLPSFSSLTKTDIVWVKVVEMRSTRVNVETMENLKGGVGKGVDGGTSLRLPLKAKISLRKLEIKKQTVSTKASFKESNKKPGILTRVKSSGKKNISHDKRPVSAKENMSYETRGTKQSERTILVPPKPSRVEKPSYPFIARKMRYEGVVVLDIEVLPDGRVGEVKVVESSGYNILDKAAIEAVRKWTFVPAQRDGKAVRSIVRQKVVFKLK
ncbi:MAG: periplasmic protein TonB [bacterium]|nr:MAG: TonB family protein [bacterium 42_11]MDK2871998.1 periplasmic protein TonB [bacterium]